jgi:hypothetical protein
LRIANRARVNGFSLSQTSTAARTDPQRQLQKRKGGGNGCVTSETGVATPFAPANVTV